MTGRVRVRGSRSARWRKRSAFRRNEMPDFRRNETLDFRHNETVDFSYDETVDFRRNGAEPGDVVSLGAPGASPPV
jgi:hypothetical protein